MPSRIWKYGVFQVPQRAIRHRHAPNRRLDITHYDLAFVNGLWRLGPRPNGQPSNPSMEPTRSRRGFLKFGTPEAARASGLGDPQQLEALINNEAYEGEGHTPIKALTNREGIEMQLAIANRYRNALVEVIQKQRIREFSAYLEIAWRTGNHKLCDLATELDRINRDLESAYEEHRKVRAKARARVRDPEISARITQLKNERKETYAEFKVCRAPLHKEPDVLAVKDWAVQRRKEESARFNEVAWGTRGAIDAAMDQSLSSLMPWETPDFRRFEGEGKLRVQIIKKANDILTTERLLAGRDLRVRLQLSDENPNNAILWLRIGSELPKKQPVWAHFPIVYSRPLPPLAEIKQVWVQRRSEPGRGSWDWDDSGFKWEACFQVESLTFDQPRRIGGPTGALNLGFRKLPDGSLRVGYFVGSDGYKLDIILPNHGVGVDPNGRILWRKNRAGIDASLAYARSKNAGTPKNDEVDGRSYHFEKIRDYLVAWTKEHPELTPAWLKRHMVRFQRSRSPAYLQRLLSLWFSHPHPTDETADPPRCKVSRASLFAHPEYSEVFERLLIWSRTDRHDEQHESGNRRRALRFRDNEYRKLARALFERYAVIKVIAFKKSTLTRKKSPEEGESDLEAVQRRQFNTVAMGTLVAALKLAASNTGGTLVEIPVKDLRENLTIKHHICGTLSESDPRISIHLYCPYCRTEFDQDASAAENLLAMGYKMSDPESEAAEE